MGGLDPLTEVIRAITLFWPVTSSDLVRPTYVLSAPPDASLGVVLW
ncbi:hypothetical protein ACFQ51_46775 [Streptomyces kaempferi]